MHFSLIYFFKTLLTFLFITVYYTNDHTFVYLDIYIPNMYSCW